jgi:hypothetical protein
MVAFAAAGNTLGTTIAAAVTALTGPGIKLGSNGNVNNNPCNNNVNVKENTLCGDHTFTNWMMPVKALCH